MDWLYPRFCGNCFHGSKALDLLPFLKSDSNVEDFEGANCMNTHKTSKGSALRQWCACIKSFVSDPWGSGSFSPALALPE